MFFIRSYYIPVYLCIIGLFIVYSYIFITIRRQVSWYQKVTLHFKAWLSLTYRFNNSVSFCDMLLFWHTDLIILFHCVWLSKPFFEMAHIDITTAKIFLFTLPPSHPREAEAKVQTLFHIYILSSSFSEKVILPYTFHSIILQLHSINAPYSRNNNSVLHPWNKCIITPERTELSRHARQVKRTVSILVSIPFVISEWSALLVF